MRFSKLLQMDEGEEYLIQARTTDEILCLALLPIPPKITGKPPHTTPVDCVSGKRNSPH